MAKDPFIFLAKQKIFENLETIQVGLVRSVEEGMVDLENTYYNEVLDLMEEARVVDNWDELMEIVVKARTLEIDIAAWMSRHGRTTLSLTWPKQPKK